MSDRRQENTSREKERKTNSQVKGEWRQLKTAAGKKHLSLNPSDIFTFYLLNTVTRSDLDQIRSDVVLLIRFSKKGTITY